jgi:predicted metal-binding membrane protein
MGLHAGVGSVGLFLEAWAAMMAAMMLPGAVPAIVGRARVAGPGAVPLFVAAYLSVWSLVGLAVYAVGKPHSTLAAGVTTVAAGLYELTPVKQGARRRCREQTSSGLHYGVSCVGSSIGLMAVLVAVGLMTVPWMAVIAAVMFVQKVLPPKAALDVTLALAATGLGVLIFLSPASVPGLTPPM